MTRTVDIAIVGAGFSGSLLALQILRANADARVFLIERAEQFGRGLAYGAADSGHLLNVRAANMSAFPDEPDHFTDWLRSTVPPGKAAPTFVSRQLYGAYLQALLGTIIQTEHGAGRLIAVGDEVAEVDFGGSRPRLRLALGHDLDADYVVLATGNLPPRDLPCLADAASSRYIRDPWSEGSLADCAPDDSILLIGTGLTAVDMIVRLKGLGHTGPIAAVSRRGLHPHRHVDRGPGITPLALPSRPALTALLRYVRAEAEAKSWREAVDGIRHGVQRLWFEASADERGRFLRHLRPWWDVHRHRVAPSVADLVDDLTAQGALTFAAGRIESVRFDDDGADVAWRRRGATTNGTMRVDRIVNCTGPAGNLAEARLPLIRDLLNRGYARPDAHELGLDVDGDCRIIDAHGRPQERLLAIGPMSRGAFWEITAVPDIRVQAARLARQLAVDVDRDAGPTPEDGRAGS